MRSLTANALSGGVHLSCVMSSGHSTAWLLCTLPSSSDFSSPCLAPRPEILPKECAQLFSGHTCALHSCKILTSSPKLAVNSLRALFSAFRTGRMDNLVLQAVEEVALEGPEGDAHQPPQYLSFHLDHSLTSASWYRMHRTAALDCA